MNDTGKSISELPLAPSDEGRQSPVADHSGSGSFFHSIGWNGARHILVVDDSEPVAIVFSRAAAKLGFMADVAGDGAQAVSLFSGNPHLYALALVDLNLPGGMGGAEVIRELRRIRPDIPAILTSGYSLEATTRSLGTMDTIGYLQKPFRLDVLASALRRALEPQLRRESR